VSDPHVAPAALLLGKEPLVPLNRRVVGLRASLDLLEDRRPFAPAGNRAPSGQAYSLITVPTLTFSVVI
jgi:hypothetical protein